MGAAQATRGLVLRCCGGVGGGAGANVAQRGVGDPGVPGLLASQHCPRSAGGKPGYPAASPRAGLLGNPEQKQAGGWGMCAGPAAAFLFFRENLGQRLTSLELGSDMT